MNIIITYTNNQYILNLSDAVRFVILLIICTLFLGYIMGVLTYIISRYVSKIKLKHDINIITIGDNDEKLLLTNASDIEWVKSYIVDMPDPNSVKYVYNHYTDDAYKIIGGIDFIPIDRYDEDI